ncbi:hypothetical protein F4780DRAFT_775290 [Xylariomycetidae sp. FL0641]|nr:hypothetical protein F4780DRAFT_775290 [Xylariomycetidae sp. FL0641]
MTGSKTPGQNNAASDKFQKKQAQAQGLGADNAPAHKEGHAPGEAPVASDSGVTNVGIEGGSTNIPGEKGIGGKPGSKDPKGQSYLSSGEQSLVGASASTRAARVLEALAASLHRRLSP